MTNYREALRIGDLGINKQNIATACECSRSTVVTLADAICDRIVYDSYTIMIEGDSMQKKKSING